MKEAQLSRALEHIEDWIVPIFVGFVGFGVVLLVAVS